MLHRSSFTKVWTGILACAVVAVSAVPDAHGQSAGAAANPPGSQSPPAAPKGPKWQVDELTYDFGKVWAGGVLVNGFVVHNVGTDVLRILEAKPKCACSVADDYPREIPPGGEGAIKFKLNTAGKSGPIAETIAIKTNDPDTPYMILEMRGTVKTVCRMEVIDDGAAKPGTSEFADIRGMGANFGRVTANQKLRRVIRMTNTTGEPLNLKMLGVNQAAPRFKAELKETKPKEEFELTVTGEGPYSDGYNNASILFTTGIIENPDYAVAIHAYVPPRVEVVPTKMIVDPKYPIQPIRALRITNNGDAHFEITSISCSNPDFDITLMPIRAQTPKTREIKVKLPLGLYRPPRYGDVIRVETTDPEHLVIDVYVLPEVNMEPEPRPEGLPLTFHPAKMN